MGLEGPLVRFDRSSLLLLSSARRERGSGERQRLTGIQGWGWNGQIEGVLWVVAGPSEVEGIAGGELRGGEKLWWRSAL